jgi:hypothetical protein
MKKIMDLKIPRKNISEMVLYVWKIIGLPSISQEDLIYTLSFNLFLYDSIAAKEFISLAIEEGLLLKSPQNILSPSKILKNKLQKWQDERKADIREKLKAIQIIRRIESTSKDESTNFTTLFRIFVDDATLTRTASILQSDITYLKKEFDQGIIQAKVKGSKEISYSIEINLKNKYIHHNCHDFETRKSKNKKLCKHLAKLFLMLKDENENKTTLLLNEIANQINDWSFD